MIIKKIYEGGYEMEVVSITYLKTTVLNNALTHHLAKFALLKKPY